MPRRGSLLLLLAAFLFGCHIGPRAASFPPAQRPAGVQTSLKSSAGILEGELLEVGSTGMLLLVGREIVRVPFRAVRHGEFHKMPSATEIRDGRAPGHAARRQLALVSRFPQGVNDELMRKLLAAYAQPEVRTWGLMPEPEGAANGDDPGNDRLDGRGGDDVL